MKTGVRCFGIGGHFVTLGILTGNFAAGQTLVIPNRTRPKVEPPTTALEFSASPTPEEFFRARVFAEPLVPVGGKPTPDENSDLAARRCLATRSAPDPMISPA